MSVADLVKEFDSRKAVPVDVNDVVAAIAHRGIMDEIYFFPAALDAEVLRGQLVHWDPAKDWEYPIDAMKGEMRSVAEIYYAKTLTDDWQRLVCCKEVLHILDPEPAQASTVEEVIRLSEKIVLPADLQDVTDGHQTLTDRIALVQAAALLFPWRARELILNNGSLSQQEVAKLVDLPERYVALVMNAVWVDIHEIIVNF